jgi:hypothetical protein
VRIPNINQTGVPGAEQISLGAISSAAQGKMKATQSLTKVVDDYQAKVQKAETDEEYSRLSNGFTRDTGAAWEEIKTQAQVDGNGAPTHDQLMPQYQAAHDKILKDYKGRVKFNPNQAAFTQFADRTLTGNTNTVRGEAGRRTISHLSGAYQQSKIDLMNGANGLEDFAKVQESAVATGLVSSGQAAVDYDSFQHEYQTNQIMSQFKSEREMGRGEAYVTDMAFPESFDEGEQQLMIDRMNADLRNDQVIVEREAAKVKREGTVLEAKTWNAARKGKTILESGQPMTEEYLGQINDTISQLTDPDHQEQMSLSLDVYNNIQSVMSMTREDRTEAINQTFDPTTDYRGWVVQQSTKKAYGKIERAIASDPHQAFLMYGGGEPIEKITKDNIAESLATAQDNQASVSAWIGEEAPPMSLAQLNDLKKIGVPALDDILVAYDKPEAEKLLTLLYKDGAGEMAAVGAIALQVDGESSYNHYLSGAKILDENKDYALGNEIGANNDSARSLFHAATKGLFPRHAEFSKSLQDVAGKIYVSLAEQSQLKPGELNADLYEQAVTLAVGNIVDYNDNPLIMPTRQWTEDKFNKAIETLTLEQVDVMGGFAEATLKGRNGQARTVTPESMLSKLQSGDAQLRQGSEFGQYQVFFDGRPVENAAGTQFILDFSEK